MTCESYLNHKTVSVTHQSKKGNTVKNYVKHSDMFMAMTDGGDEPEYNNGNKQAKEKAMIPGKFAEQFVQKLEYEYYRDPLMKKIPFRYQLKKAIKDAKKGNPGHSTFAMIQLVC